MSKTTSKKHDPSMSTTFQPHSPKTAPITLALDLATTTGWAAWTGVNIHRGTWSFPTRKGRKGKKDDHPGTKFRGLRQKVEDCFNLYVPEVIVVERPGHFLSAGAAFSSIGLRAVVYELACLHQIPVVDVSPMAIKKWATGHGSSDKTQMLAAAHRHQLHCPFPTDPECVASGFADDNEADAFLLLLYYLATGDE